jgi:hypothetical protein
MSRVSEVPAHSPLLALPDPCLLAVLQCCAVDHQRSLFSAARAHSRLHQAAVAALHSITALVQHQQHANDVLLYLGKHGSHVNSLKLHRLQGEWLILQQLPPSLQLHSLELQRWRVQLLPSNASQGVMAAAAGSPPLKQLRLSACTLLDGVEGLAAAPVQLRALEHLMLREIHDSATYNWFCFPTGVLQHLQQLTYLELAIVILQGPDPTSPALQPLTALTRLADLRLSAHIFALSVTARMLSGMCHLTRLVLQGVVFESDALVGKTKLQHLALSTGSLSGGAAGLASMLDNMQPLQQLTHLSVYSTLHTSTAPAAAYSSLTASSKLQHLNISRCTLPAGVWQHLFPAGRQLPHLRTLDLSHNKQPTGDTAPAPQVGPLVSCCPGLQRLLLSDMLCTTKQLNLLRAGVAPGAVWH